MLKKFVYQSFVYLFSFLCYRKGRNKCWSNSALIKLPSSFSYKIIDFCWQKKSVSKRNNVYIDSYTRIRKIKLYRSIQRAISIFNGKFIHSTGFHFRYNTDIWQTNILTHRIFFIQFLVQIKHKFSI